VERVAAAGVSPGRCGVIAFFRAQAALVRSLLEPRLQLLEQLAGQAATQRRGGGPPPAGDGSGAADASGDEGGREPEEQEEEEGEQQLSRSIQVATVDSFQGAECDVIILTTAVTRPGAFASGASPG
jgi:superfamily I DNA and/or RNA helicase